MAKINRYELSSPRIEEEIFIEYTNGNLSAIVLPIKYPLKEKAYKKLMENLPLVEDRIALLADIGLTITQEIPINIKNAMWCEKYMQYHENEKYVITPSETQRLKLFKITYDLLDHYFTSVNFLFLGKHGIYNITRYYNELVADYASKGKKKFPNFYDEKVANKLSTAELPLYWRHLTSLGLEPKKNSLGALTGWVKKV